MNSTQVQMVADGGEVLLEACVDGSDKTTELQCTQYGKAVRATLPAYIELQGESHVHSEHGSYCELTVRLRATGAEVGRWMYLWHHADLAKHILGLENLLRRLCRVPECRESDVHPMQDQLSQIHSFMTGEAMQWLTDDQGQGIFAQPDAHVEADLLEWAAQKDLTFFIAFYRMHMGNKGSAAHESHQCIDVTAIPEQQVDVKQTQVDVKETLTDPSNYFHLGYSFFAVAACSFRAMHSLHISALLWLIADLSWMWVMRPSIRSACTIFMHVESCI